MLWSVPGSDRFDCTGGAQPKRGGGRVCVPGRHGPSDHQRGHHRVDRGRKPGVVRGTGFPGRPGGNGTRTVRGFRRFGSWTGLPGSPMPRTFPASSPTTLFFETSICPVVHSRWDHLRGSMGFGRRDRATVGLLVSTRPRARRSSLCRRRKRPRPMRWATPSWPVTATRTCHSLWSTTFGAGPGPRTSRYCA